MAQRAACLLAALVLVGSARPALAVDTEQRDFSIYVNGKQAGQSRLTLVQQDDGSTYVTASAEVNVQKALFQYRWKTDVQEWWKDGRLVGLKSVSEENKDRTEVVVATANKQTKLSVNGEARTLNNADVWTTSYWKLADARFHNHPVPLLEVDTGKEMTGQLQFKGKDQRTVNGQLEMCYHFQITGIPAPIDLWFDQYHRLVRQEFTELGQKTIVQLNSITRR